MFLQKNIWICLYKITLFTLYNTHKNYIWDKLQVIVWWPSHGDEFQVIFCLSPSYILYNTNENVWNKFLTLSTPTTTKINPLINQERERGRDHSINNGNLQMIELHVVFPPFAYLYFLICLHRIIIQWR